jgi:hypothetical protein
MSLNVLMAERGWQARHPERSNSKLLVVDDCIPTITHAPANQFAQSTVLEFHDPIGIKPVQRADHGCQLPHAVMAERERLIHDLYGSTQFPQFG